jgi:dihydrofolate reductase
MSSDLPFRPKAMTQITVDISMSLDGFVAGPNPTLEDPLGKDGLLLHEWIFGLPTWRERHGLAGGEGSPDDELIAANLAATGAVVMGRRMWSGGAGPWAADPNADGWWGDAPPYDVPVFVVTHHSRPSETKRGTAISFVTAGAEAAVGRARAAAGEKNVTIAGGAAVIQQAMRAGLVDELRLHVAPVFLGDGVRLFDGVDARLQVAEVVSSPGVTHLTYRVTN